ncbi:LysR family transcriptional regulator, partial [Gluconobacter thailandicus]
HCLRDQALSICPTVPRQREPRLATSLEMLWHMIGAGEGFSLIPKLALRNRMDFESLITIRPLSEPEASRTIGLAWRASDPRASTFRELGKFLRQNTPDGCKIYSA